MGFWAAAVLTVAAVLALGAAWAFEWGYRTGRREREDEHGE
jgi:hypothetical protein